MSRTHTQQEFTFISYNIIDPALCQEQKQTRKRAVSELLLHTDLVSTRDQAERAESYVRYVRSVAAHPAFVGCHWFQYIDEPITGRFWDGENYNIGFVTVVDSPYPELVEAAKKVHAQIYKLRCKQADE